MKPILTRAIVGLALLFGGGSVAIAADQQSAPPPPTQAAPGHPNAAPSKAAPKQAPPQQPVQNLPASLEQSLYLIRSTLLTLNDANRSGNYTVLRDLAAPGFQAKNTAADLARIFTDLRERHVDLFEAALMAPQLTSPPRLDASGALRLTGNFPTKPLRIAFDLLFENVGGQWRLLGISVQTPPAG